MPEAHACGPLDVGHVFESAGRTITESDIVGFACLSGDFNRLRRPRIRQGHALRAAHRPRSAGAVGAVRPDYQSSGYRRLEPHVLALIDLHCRFPKPTFIGDTIFVRVTVAERTVNHRPGKDKVVFRREAINQRGEVVAQADFAMLMRPMESQA